MSRSILEGKDIWETNDHDKNDLWN